MSKLFTVFGATGKQGGSVIKTILAHPTLSKQYKLRAVTRDPSKPASEALMQQGVEVVKADLNEKESVRKAVEGSQVVFGVTNCKQIPPPLAAWRNKVPTSRGTNWWHERNHGFPTWEFSKRPSSPRGEYR